MGWEAPSHGKFSMNWLALDIGGANLKVADGHGFAESYSFALWKDPNGLSQQDRKSVV